MSSGRGYVFNSTRQTFVATELQQANSHLTRLRGLIGQSERTFRPGTALWIVPCRGVHTCLMSFPIDVLYLDEDCRVIRVEENVKPWRFTPVESLATTVLELRAHGVFASGTQVGDILEVAVEDANRPAAMSA